MTSDTHACETIDDLRDELYVVETAALWEFGVSAAMVAYTPRLFGGALKPLMWRRLAAMKLDLDWQRALFFKDGIPIPWE